MINLKKSDILGHFDFHTSVEAIRSCYIAASKKSVSLPPVGHIPFPLVNGDCHIKAGHIHEEPIFVIKIATGFYDNPKIGKSSSNGMMVVFSALTGEPVAVLQDEGWLTDMRTGIGGALATCALAKRSARNVLLLGAGIQCRMQANALAKLFESSLKFNIWARSKEKAELAANDLSASGLSAAATLDLEASVRNSEIIITTTPATSALFHADWISKGTHITAIGADSPGKQEVDQKLVENADVVVCDLADQSLDHGEFQHAHKAGVLKEVKEIGDILNGKTLGRTTDDQITIVDLTGIAPQDIAITGSILKAYELKAEI